MNRREAFATALGLDYAETEDYRYQPKGGVPAVYAREQDYYTVATESEILKIKARYSHLEAFDTSWQKTTDSYQFEVVAKAGKGWFLWIHTSK